MNEEKQRQLLDLWQQGASNKNISDTLKIKMSNVSYWKAKIKKNGIKTYPRSGRPIVKMDRSEYTLEYYQKRDTEKREKNRRYQIEHKYGISYDEYLKRKKLSTGDLPHPMETGI